ncbi:MAG: gluconate 2-dehydrogenase subunit 3 family protein [Polyangiaceae bacterium]
MTDESIVRRRFLTLAGRSGAAALLTAACEPVHALSPASPVLPAPSGAPQVAPVTSVTSGAAPIPAPADTPLTLNATEYAFVVAAADTFIPADALSPSGSECGVAVFIDRELAGAFGSGARVYRSGPFLKGKPEHGYQLPLTPRELFRVGIAATNDWLIRSQGKPFDALSEAQRASALQALEHGEAPLHGAPVTEFFEALLALTMEGFFADPIYGGNRDKASWKMLGYPGLPATYGRVLDSQHGKRFTQAPQSISDFS